MIEYKCNQNSLRGINMIVNPVRFFIALIIFGWIGMCWDMIQETQAIPYEQRMLEKQTNLEINK
mgnify:CR=1 FL=1